MFDSRIINGTEVKVDTITLGTIIKAQVNSEGTRDSMVLGIVSEVVSLNGEKHDYNFWKDYSDIAIANYIVECINIQFRELD